MKNGICQSRKWPAKGEAAKKPYPSGNILHTIRNLTRLKNRPDPRRVTINGKENVQNNLYDQSIFGIPCYNIPQDPYRSTSRPLIEESLHYQNTKKKLEYYIITLFVYFLLHFPFPVYLDFLISLAMNG